VKKVINNITINNNIHNYFAPKQGPAPAPDAQSVIEGWISHAQQIV
jgi:hypothetical protein